MRWIILSVLLWALAAYLASSCSSNLIDRARADCERSGGIFATLCIYNGKIA